jgi:hypothetical protein
MHEVVIECEGDVDQGSQQQEEGGQEAAQVLGVKYTLQVQQSKNNNIRCPLAQTQQPTPRLLRPLLTRQGH